MVKYRLKKRLTKALCALLCAGLLAGCNFVNPVAENDRLFDNDGVYSMPKDGWYTLWLEVCDTPGEPFSRATGQTRDASGEKPRYSAYLYDGDGLMATEESFALAEVQLKGNNLFRHQYRSFKVTLLGEERWLGQRIFSLYKCPEDSTKISMRFGLDAYALFDSIVSVSAGFVDLKMKDATAGETEYGDYGLYTQVEHLGGRYLRSHGLDRNGLLYEAKDFGFEYEVWMALDETDRRAALEQNNGEGHDKLEALLAELDVTEDFDAFFERHFDRGNYLTWLAGAVLLGNTRASRDTYQLYSPSDSEKWYFLPAPTDRLMRAADQRRNSDPPDAYYGVGMLYSNVLHARFLQSSANRQALADKVEELRAVLNDAAITGLCDSYKLALSEFVGRNPDYGMLKYSPQETEARINDYPQLVANYKSLFDENIQRPAPFSVQAPVLEGGAWQLNWADMRLDGEELTYHVALTSDPEGANVLHSESTTGTTLALPELPDGIAYLHLTAENQEGITQLANSTVAGTDGKSLWGVARLVYTGGEVAYG